MAPTPNLLLATTYALNASNTKRAVVGMEWHGGYYRPVVKLTGGNSSTSTVTLDDDAWELFTQQQDPIAHYFQDAAEPLAGNPTTFSLDSAEISLTRCYGVKAIIISELPQPPVRDLRYAERFDSQLFDDQARFEAPPAKKQKENLASIAMHPSTYYGLRSLIKCIDLRMRYLEEQAPLLNRVVDKIIEYLKQEMSKVIDAEVKNSLIDYTAFKKYLSPKKKEMYSVVMKSQNFFNLSQTTFDFIFEELYAFGMLPVAKHLYTEFCEK